MTPPKDCNFLANIGYPFYVTAHWNEAMGYFVYAELQVDLYGGEYNDTYYITDNFKEEDLISWVDMPKLFEGTK